MPWHLKQGHSGCPTSKPWAVVLDATGKVVGCHISKKDAQAQLAALNIHAKGAPPMTDRAEFHAEAAKLRAASLGVEQRAVVPNAGTRVPTPPLPTKWERAEPAQRDGADYFVVEGVASTVEQPYEMFDLFGPYTEVVSRAAFEATLAAKPMVMFRFNHTGTPMATTRSDRLELWTDERGLGDRAWLNPQRPDVQELIHAIRDGDVTEQSFMFHIDDGEWNDEFTEFRINRVNLDRGDVGPVAYGANPTTSVAARSGELLAAIPDLPPLVAREAYTLLTARRDIGIPEPVPVAADQTALDPDQGKSLRLALAQLELDKQRS